MGGRKQVHNCTQKIALGSLYCFAFLSSKENVHEPWVKLRGPMTGYPCTENLHGLRIKVRAPIADDPCTEGLHELRAELCASLKGRPKKIGCQETWCMTVCFTAFFTCGSGHPHGGKCNQHYGDT